MSDSDLPISLRVNEAMRQLGVGHSTFYNLMSAGRIRYRELGGIRLIDREELVAFRNSLPIAEPRWSEPSGTLLGADQQQIAVERASDAPKRKRRKSKPKARARGAQGAAPALEPEPKPKPVPAPLAPEPDYAAMLAERLKLLAPSDGEGQLRALEAVVLACSRDRNCNLDDAKQLVLAAIAKAKKPV